MEYLHIFSYSILFISISLVLHLLHINTHFTTHFKIQTYLSFLIALILGTWRDYNHNDYMLYIPAYFTVLEIIVMRYAVSYYKYKPIIFLLIIVLIDFDSSGAYAVVFMKILLILIFISNLDLKSTLTSIALLPSIANNFYRNIYTDILANLSISYLLLYFYLNTRHRLEEELSKISTYRKDIVKSKDV